MLRLFLALVFAYAVIVLLMFLGQNRLLFIPGLPGRDLVATPERLGLDYDDLAIETADGEHLHAWYLPGQDNADLIVVIFHGNAGNISHRLDTLRIWHELGLSTLIFDYRGYGRSTGRPSEAGTYRDAEAVWAQVLGLGYAPEQTILFGRSLGGAVAVWLTKNLEQTRQRPGGLIIESSFTSAPDLAAELYPWLPVRWLARIRYPSEERLSEIRTPVLVVHSPTDEIIPFHHGEALYRAAAGRSALLELDGDHNTGFLASGRRYTDGLRQFLETLP